ncbi:host attachment protein [Sphingomonadaceae bacterium jetA1]|jgi:protein required for attachment to host cells|uniref:baeRF12 domain-containing protein n=1 Tax=Facivitalis istanbulensis TaxID=3075838 RepID=UPI0034700A1E
MGEADHHQPAEDRFAAETAAMLRQRALADELESLVIVAARRMPGELRKHYHKEVSDRLVAELAKDLTDHMVPDIAAALQ